MSVTDKWIKQLQKSLPFTLEANAFGMLRARRKDDGGVIDFKGTEEFVVRKLYKKCLRLMAENEKKDRRIAELEQALDWWIHRGVQDALEEVTPDAGVEPPQKDYGV